MRKHKGKKSVAGIKTGIMPTKERHQHNGGVIAEAIKLDSKDMPILHRYRAVWECPLDAYKDNKIITEPEYRSGLRFRQAYYRAVLSRRAGYEHLNNHPIETRPTVSERILKEAYRNLSPYNMGAVINICGHDRQAESDKQVKALRNGLGRLAQCWNMAAVEITKPIRQKV